MNQQKIESMVLARLKGDLADPKRIASYVQGYLADRRARATKARREKSVTESRLTANTRAIAALVDALADGVMTRNEIAPRLELLRAEKLRLTALLASAEEATHSVLEVHPQTIGRFRQTVEAIAATLAEAGNLSDELEARLRELMHSVTVMPKKPFGDYEIGMQGHISALVGEEVWPHRQVGCSVGAG